MYNVYTTHAVRQKNNNGEYDDEDENQRDPLAVGRPYTYIWVYVKWYNVLLANSIT